MTWNFSLTVVVIKLRQTSALFTSVAIKKKRNPDPDKYPARAGHLTNVGLGQAARVARGRGSLITDFARDRWARVGVPPRPCQPGSRLQQWATLGVQRLAGHRPRPQPDSEGKQS